MLSLLHVAFPVACSQDSRDASPPQAAQAVMLDAIHGPTAQRVAGFYSLPPIVSQPGPHGDVIAMAAPMVRIDQIDPATSAMIREVARFTATSGPVRVATLVVGEGAQSLLGERAHRCSGGSVAQLHLARGYAKTLLRSRLPEIVR